MTDMRISVKCPMGEFTSDWISVESIETLETWRNALKKPSYLVFPMNGNTRTAIFSEKIMEQSICFIELKV